MQQTTETLIRQYGECLDDVDRGVPGATERLSRSRKRIAERIAEEHPSATPERVARIVAEICD